MSAIYDAILGRLRQKDAGGGGGGGDIGISDVTGLQSALNGKVSANTKGQPNGVPTLDADGKIPGGQIDLSQDVTTIPSATTAYTLSPLASNGGVPAYVHAPTSAPVYTLPDVDDATVAHAIILTVDFSNVQSIAFVDEDSETIAPLDDLTILAGDVVQYLCWYDNLQSKWVIGAGYIKGRS